MRCQKWQTASWINGHFKYAPFIAILKNLFLIRGTWQRKEIINIWLIGLIYQWQNVRVTKCICSYPFNMSHAQWTLLLAIYVDWVQLNNVTCVLKWTLTPSISGTRGKVSGRLESDMWPAALACADVTRIGLLLQVKWVCTLNIRHTSTLNRGFVLK